MFDDGDYEALYAQVMNLPQTEVNSQLMPQEFESACKLAAQPLTLRRHAGYDHGYYFIATFIEDHIRFHAKILDA